MNEVSKFWARPILAWIYTLLGDALLIVGIVTAAMNVTIFAGFTPILWFLLALACYLGAISNIALRILAHLQRMAKS